jgi:hypothetical protein
MRQASGAEELGLCGLRQIVAPSRLPLLARPMIVRSGLAPDAGGARKSRQFQASCGPQEVAAAAADRLEMTTPPV